MLGLRRLCKCGTKYLDGWVANSGDSMTEERKPERSKLSKQIQEQNLRRIERAARAAKNPLAVMRELTEERIRQIESLRRS